MSHRPATPAENLLTILALHSDSFSPAEQRELREAASLLSTSEERSMAALHACEGLDTSDLKGNKRGWLHEVVHAAARVESDLHSALRERCAGNTKDDEPVECQAYEASEQARPCPVGCCVMADPKDVRSIIEAIEREDAPVSESGRGDTAKLLETLFDYWLTDADPAELPEFQQEVRAALRSNGGSAKVPEGWKLVREFPTAEQQIAGVKAAGGTLAEGFIVGIYRAMLAASPSSQEEKR